MRMLYLVAVFTAFFLGWCAAQSPPKDDFHKIVYEQVQDLEKKSKDMIYDINFKLDALVKTMEDSTRNLMRKEREMRRRMFTAEETLKLLIYTAQEESDAVSRSWQLPTAFLFVICIAIAYFTYTSDTKYPLLEAAKKRMHSMVLGTPNLKRLTPKDRAASFSGSWTKTSDNSYSPLLRKVGV